MRADDRWSLRDNLEFVVKVPSVPREAWSRGEFREIDEIRTRLLKLTYAEVDRILRSTAWHRLKFRLTSFRLRRKCWSAETCTLKWSAVPCSRRFSWAWVEMCNERVDHILVWLRFRMQTGRASLLGLDMLKMSSWAYVLNWVEGCQGRQAAQTPQIAGKPRDLTDVGVYSRNFQNSWALKTYENIWKHMKTY